MFSVSKLWPTVGKYWFCVVTASSNLEVGKKMLLCTVMNGVKRVQIVS